MSTPRTARSPDCVGPKRPLRDEEAEEIWHVVVATLPDRADAAGNQRRIVRLLACAGPKRPSELRQSKWIMPEAGLRGTREANVAHQLGLRFISLRRSLAQTDSDSQRPQISSALHPYRNCGRDDASHHLFAAAFGLQRPESTKRSDVLQARHCLGKAVTPVGARGGEDPKASPDALVASHHLSPDDLSCTNWLVAPKGLSAVWNPANAA